VWARFPPNEASKAAMRKGCFTSIRGVPILATNASFGST
jgi:hypothetical protein